jgi:hypothetical protein
LGSFFLFLSFLLLLLLAVVVFVWLGEMATVLDVSYRAKLADEYKSILEQGPGENNQGVDALRKLIFIAGIHGDPVCRENPTNQPTCDTDDESMIVETEG